MQLEPVVYTPEEACCLLGISRRVLYSRCRKGLIPHLRLGKKTVRFPKHSFNEYLKQQGG